jgi:glycosyltransferase involved in cell wall biosynthesis
MEQTLGHRAHTKTLRESVECDPNVEARWSEIAFDSSGLPWGLPVIRHNWTLRGSLRANTAMRQMTNEGVDALFVHTITISLLAARYAGRVPLVLSLDATPENYDQVGSWYNHRALPAPVEAIKRRIRSRVVRRAAALVTWCQWAKDSLIADYGVEEDRVHVIFPGADLSRFPFGNARRLIEDDRLARVLFVGGDFHRKGGHVLLQAYRSSLRNVAELHLVTEEPIEEERGVHVYRGLGPNSPQLLSLYENADIFVLPTLGDCFPVVMGEAMAAGLPIVTTNVGAVGEAVTHGENGFIVPAGDDVALVSALNTLALNPALRQTMGRKGRAMAELHHDSRLNANRVLEVIKGVCRRDEATVEEAKAVLA